MKDLCLQKLSQLFHWECGGKEEIILNLNIQKNYFSSILSCNYYSSAGLYLDRALWPRRPTALPKLRLSPPLQTLSLGDGTPTLPSPDYTSHLPHLGEKAWLALIKQMNGNDM